MRRACHVIAALALALGVNTLAVDVTPVAAHTTCTADRFCVWQHIDYGGVEHEHFTNTSNDWNFWGIENDDDSLQNISARYTHVYDDANYGNPVYCALPSEVEDDIHSNRDDRGDSHTMNYTEGCSGWASP